MGRRTVYARTYLDWDGRCAYCKVELHRCAAYGSRKFGLPKGTVDHFIPRSKGGGNTRCNRVLVCLECNGDKGCIDPRGPEGTVVRWLHVAARLEVIGLTSMVAVKDVKTLLKAAFPLDDGSTTQGM